MTLTQRITLYIQLTRLHRPIGILLLLWPTLWGLWFAGEGHPDLHILIIFIIGTVLMRSAGCAINDFADHRIDKHVKRTKTRPIANGSIPPVEALWLAGALTLCAFLLILPLNTLTLLFSIPAVLLAATYPFTKRFFAIPQAYLGIAFGFGIPMAFAAQLGDVPLIAWLLLLANVFWAIAYDTEYAMVDRDDDIHLGIHSSAIFFGKYDVVAVMASYGMALVLLTTAGQMAGLGWGYNTGLLAAAVISAYHYNLIKQRNRESCFAAFINNNWFGAAIFAGLFIDYLL